MKLRKIVKHLDEIADVRLYNAESELLWEGSVINLAVNNDDKKEREQYLEECYLDRAYEDINQVFSSEKFLDWKLDSGDCYEAISAIHEVNEHGYAKLIFIICIKEK